MNDIYIIIMSLHSIYSFNNSFNYVFYFVLKIILVKTYVIFSTYIRYTYYFFEISYIFNKIENENFFGSVFNL